MCEMIFLDSEDDIKSQRSGWEREWILAADRWVRYSTTPPQHKVLLGHAPAVTVDSPVQGLPGQESSMPDDPTASEKRIGLIRSVRTPLGFFVLVVLVVEGGMAVLVTQTEEDVLLITGILVILAGLVAVVGNR